MRYRPLPPIVALCAPLVLSDIPLFAADPPEDSQRRRVSVAGHPYVGYAMTVTLTGPSSGEDAEPNPFRGYRLEVVFEHDEAAYTVPGYFAADGEAAETGATTGDRWRAHFAPDRPGQWRYRAAFRAGEDVALGDSAAAGRELSGFTAAGAFEIHPADALPAERRRPGMLRYVGGRYLRFAGSGEYFLKGGADSPENFLAYHEFDGTYSVRQPGTHRAGEAVTAPLHRYGPHVRDWREGDPSWRGGRGRGIIGALNYLASRGVNSVYFLTMNVAGDGNDVWPWTSHEQRDRFDCSKLDQWQMVFDHMDHLGVMMHVVLTETENESLFEVEAGGEGRRGDFADARKLYYRELIARFAHHPALIWNLGEENGWDDTERNTTGPAGAANTESQRRAFAAYIRALDPYDHPIVVHTLPGDYDRIYTPLLGYEHLEGPSLQMGDMTRTHAETIRWIDRSAEAGRPWVVCLDEIGPAHTGVRPDAEADDDHFEVRRHALWGNLMAGGAGVEWYFGYQYAHNDLNCEDFRSRQRMWDQTRHALAFFHRHLPFAEMAHADDLVEAEGAYCLARPGEVYAVYLPRLRRENQPRPPRIRLRPGVYTVRWYDPRGGGDLAAGTTTELNVPRRQQLVPIGLPPAELDQDWVALIRRAE